MALLTILSMALAATSSVMVWRLRRREARRSDARVAALSSAIYGTDGPVNAETSNAIATFPSEFLMDVTADRAARTLTGLRAVATVSVGVLLIAGLMILAAMRPRAGHGPEGTTLAERSAVAPPATRPPAQTAAPLELIALSHERAKDTLIVRGAIRNPSNGTECEMPAVVVLTFDEHGIFLSSSESQAGAQSLAPGAQANFSVSVAAKTAAPARYKVSFRSADRVVPHVDKRVPDAATGRSDDAPSPRRARAAAPVQS